MPAAAPPGIPRCSHPRVRAQRLGAVLRARRHHRACRDLAVAQAGARAQHHAATDDAPLQLHTVLDDHVCLHERAVSNKDK